MRKYLEGVMDRREYRRILREFEFPPQRTKYYTTIKDIDRLFTNERIFGI